MQYQCISRKPCTCAPLIEAGWKGQGLFSLFGRVVWTSLILVLKMRHTATQNVRFAKLQGRTEHAESCGFQHQGTKVSCFNFLLGSLEFMVVHAARLCASGLCSWRPTLRSGTAEICEVWKSFSTLTAVSSASAVDVASTFPRWASHENGCTRSLDCMVLMQRAGLYLLSRVCLETFWDTGRMAP